MVKKLILGLVGLAIVAAGVVSFSAFTAQWVNVHARVEKEIEIACVTPILDAGALRGGHRVVGASLRGRLQPGDRPSGLRRHHPLPGGQAHLRPPDLERRL